MTLCCLKFGGWIPDFGAAQSPDQISKTVLLPTVLITAKRTMSKYSAVQIVIIRTCLLGFYERAFVKRDKRENPVSLSGFITYILGWQPAHDGRDWETNTAKEDPPRSDFYKEAPEVSNEDSLRDFLLGESQFLPTKTLDHLCEMLRSNGALTTNGLVDANRAAFDDLELSMRRSNVRTGDAPKSGSYFCQIDPDDETTFNFLDLADERGVSAMTFRHGVMFYPVGIGEDVQGLKIDSLKSSDGRFPIFYGFYIPKGPNWGSLVEFNRDYTSSLKIEFSATGELILVGFGQYKTLPMQYEKLSFNKSLHKSGILRIMSINSTSLYFKSGALLPSSRMKDDFNPAATEKFLNSLNLLNERQLVAALMDGADINAQDERGRTVLHYVASLASPIYDVLRWKPDARDFAYEIWLHRYEDKFGSREAVEAHWQKAVSNLDPLLTDKVGLFPSAYVPDVTLDNDPDDVFAFNREQYFWDVLRFEAQTAHARGLQLYELHRRDGHPFPNLF